MTNQQRTTQELHVVYQSNESVPMSGEYQVVQNRPAERAVRQTGPLVPYQPTTMHLNAGELFPNEEGRAVAWRLLKGDA